MTTQAECTCPTTNCATCGPSGTGCVCVTGKCNCNPCVNAPHSVDCGCHGAGVDCSCTKEGKVCTCTQSTADPASHTASK